jgi:Phage Tail Collar Domain
MAKAKAKSTKAKSTRAKTTKAQAPGPTSGYFTGQIELFGFDFAPQNFAACQGQLMPISQNQELFGLLGTRYGGNGVTTFALPKLAPAPQGVSYFICINGVYPQR